MKALVALVGSAAAFAAAAGITAMADATMSRRQTMPPGSPRSWWPTRGRRTSPNTASPRWHGALFLTCRLEVEADVVEKSFRIDDDGRFEALLAPGERSTPCRGPSS